MIQITKCIKLVAPSLFKINEIEFSSKFLLSGLAHGLGRVTLGDSEA
jgi:hypothetical protein